VPLSALPPEPTRALAEGAPGHDRRIVADRVIYAVADRGPIRLVLPAFEQVANPAASAVACVGVGLGLWALVLSLGPLLAVPRRFREEIAAWSFLAPALVHLAVFTIGPLFFAAWLSLHRWSLVDDARPFVGAENYRRVLGTADFWHAIWNTTVYTLHVPVSIALALAFALLARQRGRFAALARTTMFLPCITSLAAAAMVWQWLLHDEYGLANYVLSWFGVAPVKWLTSPATALLSVMLVSVWTTVGYQVVLLQAGLAAIPRDLYDAARIDGAGRWQQLWHVTLPGLRHTLFFVLVTSVIGSFQVFGLVYVMTDGGPLHATDVAVFHIYEEAWDYLRFGSAAAMSWVLFALIFAVTWLHFRTLERRTVE
jgi:ABC-type sugar transport system permease subunit